MLHTEFSEATEMLRDFFKYPEETFFLHQNILLQKLLKLLSSGRQFRMPSPSPQGHSVAKENATKFTQLWEKEDMNHRGDSCLRCPTALIKTTGKNSQAWQSENSPLPGWGLVRGEWHKMKCSWLREKLLKQNKTKKEHRNAETILMAGQLMVSNKPFK